MAAVVFIVAAIAAYRSLPAAASREPWVWLAVIGLVATPFTLLVNAEEYHAIARLTGTSVAFAARVRISIISSAANLLPVPGSLLVRGRDLQRRGVKIGDIGVASGVVAAAWIGSTGVLAGAGLWFTPDRIVLGSVGVGVGTLFMVAAALAATRRWPGRARDVVRALVVELVSVLVGGARLFAVATWLGIDIDGGQALALTGAAVATAAAGFVPSGLGVRELTAAGIAPIVGLPAAAGLAAAATNRFLDLAVLAPISATMMIHRPDELRPDDSEAGGDDESVEIIDQKGNGL